MMISLPVHNRAQQQDIPAVGCRSHIFLPPKPTDPRLGGSRSRGNSDEPSESLEGSRDRIEERRQHTSLAGAEVW